MTSLKITSLNVRGINGEQKRKDMSDYLEKLNSNIYFLQDIHCNKEQESIFKKDWEGKMCIAPGTSNSRGTAILFRNNFEFSVNDSKIDQQGNYIALKVNMVNTEVTLNKFIWTQCR